MRKISLITVSLLFGSQTLLSATDVTCTSTNTGVSSQAKVSFSDCYVGSRIPYLLVNTGGGVQSGSQIGTQSTDLGTFLNIAGTDIGSIKDSCNTTTKTLPSGVTSNDSIIEDGATYCAYFKTDMYLLTIQTVLNDKGSNNYEWTNVQYNVRDTSNAAPTATDLFLTDTPTSAVKGDTLTLNYTYNDDESDAETTSTFKWYTADDAQGTGKQEIANATSTTYTVTSSEEKKYIGFSVTPVNAEGSGTETFLETFILVNDTTGPTITSTTPSDGATEIAVSANIELLFNETATYGSSGTIKIVDVIDDSTTITMDINDNQLSLGNRGPFSDGSYKTVITINPTVNLDTDKTYRVEISAGVLEDDAGNPNEANSSLVSFKTVDTIAPTLISSTPVDDSSSFNASSNITLTFDENIALGSGSNALILIYELNTDNLVATIDVTNHNNQLSISNAVLTINPTDDLNFETDYYMSIVNEAITDLTGNVYVGFSDKTTLNFRTSPPSVDLTSVVTAGKWNMIAVPNERSLNASDISGATIWEYTTSWENPTTLTAGKGYWLYTTSKTGYDSISASVANSAVTDDYSTIKNSGTNGWELVGISKSTSGIFWSDIYSQTNTLSNGCSYNYIFHYDSANDSWNTTSKVPYLGAIWVKQDYCY